jgi:5'/3'-nucleotidase
MRILVTNDDGVEGPGLHALAGALHDAGHEVTVAAPLENYSGSGASIGALGVGNELVLHPASVPAFDRIPAYAVDGPPALAVMAANLGAFGERPELVVSGINPGNNTGRAVLHSGTVGAALTAANQGISGVAVSIADTAAERRYLATGQVSDERLKTHDDIHWSTAASLAVHATDWIVDAPAGTIVNLNLPDVPLDELKGVRWAEPASSGTVRAALVEVEPNRLRLELRPTGQDLPAGTDTALVRNGYGAVTLLTGVGVGVQVPIADFLERASRARTA